MDAIPLLRYGIQFPRKDRKRPPFHKKKRGLRYDVNHIRDLGGAVSITGMTDWMMSIVPSSFHLRQRRHAVT